MLYVIYGASGSGKTTLLHCVFEKYGAKAIHKKGTTRAKRQYDDIEIESFIDGLPKERFSPPNGYYYSSYGYEYGIEKKQIDKALSENIPHFVICNDIETIKQLRHDYYNKIVVIYLSFDAPREIITDIQKRRQIKDDEIELRISKIDYMKEQFSHNILLFDTSILNRYGDNPEISLRKDIESIIARYESSQLSTISNIDSPNRAIPDKEVIFATIDYLSQLIRENEQKKNVRNNIQVEKGFIFIIMPMMQRAEPNIRDSMNLTLLSIKEVAREFDYRAERVDNIPGNTSIDSKIMENIEKAEIIVADLTHERPNCYYELGYARALGKDIIIISRKGTKIHFDADHFDRIEFDSSDILQSELTTKLMKRKRKT